MELRKENKPQYTFDITGKDLADIIAQKIAEHDPEITAEELEAFRQQFLENEMGPSHYMIFRF